MKNTKINLTDLWVSETSLNKKVLCSKSIIQIKKFPPASIRPFSSAYTAQRHPQPTSSWEASTHTKVACCGSNLKIRFFVGANKVVGDKDKVTLMSYEKCQHFAIAFPPPPPAAAAFPTKERRINFPLNNFQFPRLFVFSPAVFRLPR